MINYNNSKIYKIVCNNTGLVYYGSTTQKYLSARLEQHRQVYHRCTSRKILNGGNYDILLVENVDCNSKDELRARERFYIENNECVNKNIPGRKIKEWRNDNKEKISEIGKEYYQEYKEKIAERGKKYNQDNKEKIKKYRLDNKEKIKKYRLDNKEKMIEYQKKYQTENKEKIKENNKKYKLVNKEKIKENNKKYRLDNKDKIAEKITCSCGSTIRKDNKSQHERTKKHQEFIQNQNSVQHQDCL